MQMRHWASLRPNVSETATHIRGFGVEALSRWKEHCDSLFTARRGVKGRGDRNDGSEMQN